MRLAARGDGSRCVGLFYDAIRPTWDTMASVAAALAQPRRDGALFAGPKATRARIELALTNDFPSRGDEFDCSNTCSTTANGR